MAPLLPDLVAIGALLADLPSTWRRLRPRRSPSAGHERPRPEWPATKRETDPPLRAELLSLDRLDQLAVELATDAPVTSGGPTRPLLLRRLNDNARALTRTHDRFARASVDDRLSVPVAQWLLDNYHTVQDQVREIRHDLPGGYERELPRLTAGPLAGYPRVYRLALALIAHTDSRLDGENLTRFVRAFQTATPLRMGELWACPIALRLGLVENLRRLTDEAVIAHLHGAEADRWLDDLLTRVERPSDLMLRLAESVRQPERLADAYLVRLLLRLHDPEPRLTLARQWLEQRLDEQGMTADGLIRSEGQRQAANLESVGNVITSMRLLSTLDWADFFESVSPVEALLRTDPAGRYGDMDFATRDRYRHAVEDLARRGALDEPALVEQVLRRAEDSHRRDGADVRQAHVGYYLIDAGRVELEAAVGYRPRPTTRLIRLATARPTLTYLALILAVTGLILMGLVSVLGGVMPAALLLGLLLAAIPASDLAVNVVNWGLTRLLPPRTLPKMAFDDGIPACYQTVVAVPILLTDAATIYGLLEHLEIRALANADPAFTFALLSDFTDASQADLPDDARLLALVSEGVRDLNARYGQDRFFLFHRERRWNSVQACWMGWERKRGKLHEFNRLLRGATDTSFVCVVGDRAALRGVRYVITLDADTQLPPGAAARLVGTLAHPLNTAHLDRHGRKVISGYGVIQPRVSPTLTGALASPFARLFSGSTGLDPYATAASDVYQDLFGAGSYVGKGIYDIDAFEATLAGRVPENALLSHDLFEGLYARTALATDIELYDDHPSRYVTHAQRQHRWTRGDWQLLPWLWPTVPLADGRWTANDLTVLDRWKLLDNLRRSLVPPALVTLLLAGWALLPGSALVWTSFVVLVLGFPALSGLIDAVVGLPRAIDAPGYLRGAREDLFVGLARAAVTAALLPHQAVLMGDAIVRTLARLVARRRLLEWVTAAQAETRHAGSMATTWAHMWPAALIGLACLALVVLAAPANWPAALPFLVAWLLAPVVAERLSRPTRSRRTDPSPAAAARLRRLALKTWRYFETFVGPDDHWLAPDNFQEEPKGELAHRTSPTNLGLALLSTLAAHDLGHLTTTVTLERLEKTLASMEELERFQGHFFNWYDTQTRQVLPPAYVSTVDSGNLAGHLLTLKQGILGFGQLSLPGEPQFNGLRDIVGLLEAALGGGRAEASAQPRPTVTALAGLVATTPAGLAEWRERLQAIEVSASALRDAEVTLGPQNTPPTLEVAYWAARLHQGARAMRQEIDQIAPWVTLLACPPQPLRAVALADATSGAVWRALEQPLTLNQLRAAPANAGPLLDCLRAAAADDRAGELAWVEALTAALAAGASAAAGLLAFTERLAERADSLANAMDFRLLYEPRRQLFAIGYHVPDGRLDTAYYDLLASEARLASLVAIAKGDVPLSHWFHLGRPLTRVGSGRMLLSWSGTMFEYLMPLLVMRRYPMTLLDQTYEAVVRRQVEYGRQRGVPWGISEAAYAVFDVELTYQYRAFGVPGAGLTRGLADDLVIAPYATVLAGPVAPDAALRNLARLEALGMAGRYGLYEAIDYTPARQSPGQHGVVVRTFMVHHQGMILAMLVNWLHRDAMTARFHQEPVVQAVELVLQERLPRQAPLVRSPEHDALVVEAPAQAESFVRRFTSPQTPTPRIHLLSNGEYTVMVTGSGAGFSTWKGQSITRWREDATRDHWGFFCYVRDLNTGAGWSAGYQPTTRPSDSYAVTFSTGRAEFRRSDGTIETRLEIGVSPEDDAEVRRVSVTNHGPAARVLDLTSYAEMVLAPAAADAAHPTFSNLFVETEYVPDLGAVLCSRRPRSSGEDRLWAIHVSAVAGGPHGDAEFETDRARFVGRGRSSADPAAQEPGATLSNTVGAVLDPILSLRRRLHLGAGETAEVAFVLAVAGSREAALALGDKYSHTSATERALSMAWTYDQGELHHLNLTARNAHLFLRLGARLLYHDASLRAPAEVLRRNVKGQPGLWSYGISGDLPIVLARVAEVGELGLVHELLRAHDYWRRNGLAVDLVILNEDRGGYMQALQEPIRALVQGLTAPAQIGAPGGVFLLRGDGMADEDRVLLQTAARAVLVGSRGSLARQLEVPPPTSPLPARLTPRRGPSPAPAANLPPLELVAFNGLGGFTADGREYVVHLEPGTTTPAPWINVLANPTFGCLVSEAGPGSTWAINSRENRLTPWSNDPVSDPPGEALYLRDEETGEVWTPTPRPAPGGQPYRVRHGQGYTRFEHSSHGLEQDLLIFVPLADPVRVWRLRLHNTSGVRRRLSATGYAEWVLGVSREQSERFVVTDIDPTSGALLARNAYNNEFAERIAFAAVNRPDRRLTADRTEFLGRNGSPTRPAALGRTGLSGRVGAGLDPCAALSAPIDLAPGEVTELVFLLGQGETLAQVQELVQRYRGAKAVQTAFEAVLARWDALLGAVQVRTPEPEMDLLLNRWLLYQVLSCRVWARSAFYQSGGAYGFRDQLQDVLALVVAAPTLAREQIVAAAARQFVDGDVQHWWHPPTGRGVRTRFSDDLLWLPHVTSEYIAQTGDAGVLDEVVPYLEGQSLAPGEAEAYFQPAVSGETGTLYEHCLRAIDRGLTAGAHGLPLIGAGDWNDGMNRVGVEGRGESVWVAWFLTSVLPAFADLCAVRGDCERAECYRQETERLRGAIEAHAWDGAWYRRAYFDDGTPLGSAANDECRIDAIAQAWAVISGAGEPARARRAMESVDEHLVRESDGLIQLLAPPFDHAPLDPGYIRGYVPGVRENGGQYTHAAIWVVLAHALLGNGDRAGSLFAMLNPINRTRTPERVARYKVEPYAVAADVYAVPPHTGRGGWSWYTGSAGWLYRVGLQALLGLRWQGTSFALEPCIPRHWPRYDITVTRGRTSYHITVENPDGVERGVALVELDGAPIGTARVPLVDDGAIHVVRVVLGPRRAED